MENEVLLGDCAEILKQYPDETFDCIVTDPPYGYSFMNKNWDRALPSLEALKECCRVLKSGAFAFFMSAPRQDVLSRMILRLEEAGFKTGFTSIYWVYASGFPKAQNMSKAIDRRFGAEREIIGKGQYFNRQPNGLQGATVTGFKDCIGEKYGSNGYITASATEEAKQFEGSFAGFQPKPALEVIITAMKPLDSKTYVDQALQNGHGCTWLGDCRIPYECDSEWKQHIRKDHGLGNSTDQYHFTDHKKGIPVPEGRFPANLLVSDNVLDQETCKKGIGKSYSGYENKLDNAAFNFGSEGKERRRVISDSGGFSRYFSLDAWFKSKLPEQAQKTYPFMIVPKPSKSEKNKYCENKHPTVKPLKLMSYLITMGSREGDIILDPFAGSGTTCEAARLLNRKFVGCELTEEYLNVLEARAGVKATQYPYRNLIEITENL